MTRNRFPPGNVRVRRAGLWAGPAGVRMEQRDTATNWLRHITIVGFAQSPGLSNAKASFCAAFDLCDCRHSKWRRAPKPSISGSGLVRYHDLKRRSGCRRHQ